MANQFKYKAFISYSHADIKAGEWLHKKLETYKLPKRLAANGVSESRTLGDIFRDRDELPASDDLTAAVKDALAASDYMIVICSPNAAASRWVNREIIDFKALRGEGRILSIIVDGEPFASDAGRPEDECFPPALRYKIARDGTLSNEKAEPLAADARDGMDGRKRAFLKLVAGLTGADYAALYDRNQQRKNRTVTVITAASILGVIAMGSIANEAIKAREDADHQRAEAEKLVDFMLTDLRGELDAAGRLSAFAAVGDKAVGYYEAQDLSKMTDASIGRQASAFHMLGEVQSNLGNPEAALKLYEQAASATKAAMQRDPTNPDRIFDHAQSVFYVGSIGWALDDLSLVERNWRQYLAYAEQLVAMDSENPKWLLELAFGNSNMGRFYFEGLGDTDAALEYFRNANEHHGVVLKKRPEDVSQIFRVANSHAWIADVYERKWQFGEAFKSKTSQLELLEKNFKLDPDNKRFERTLVRARLSVSQYSSWQVGRIDHDAYRDAIQHYEKVYLHDPSNRSWRGGFFATIIDYLRDCIAFGDYTRVDELTNQAEKLLSQFSQQDRVLRWFNYEFESDLVLLKAITLVEKNFSHQANTLLSRIISDQSHWAPQGLKNVDHEKLALAYFYRAILFEAAGDVEKAEQDRVDAIASFRNIKNLSPWTSTLLLKMLTHFDQYAEANSVRERMAIAIFSKKLFQ